MTDLTIAIRIAAELHLGQVDKASLPYILHPLRVMLSMDDDLRRIVAVLHDVAEDCEDGWRALHDAGFSDEVLDAVEALTRRPGEAYEDFILRASRNPLARQVKIADIRDNLRPGAESLRPRYEAALKVLEGDKL